MKKKYLHIWRVFVECLLILRYVTYVHGAPVENVYLSDSQSMLSNDQTSNSTANSTQKNLSTAEITTPLNNNQSQAETKLHGTGTPVGKGIIIKVQGRELPKDIQYDPSGFGHELSGTQPGSVKDINEESPVKIGSIAFNLTVFVDRNLNRNNDSSNDVTHALENGESMPYDISTFDGHEIIHRGHVPLPYEIPSLFARSYQHLSEYYTQKEATRSKAHGQVTRLGFPKLKSEPDKGEVTTLMNSGNGTRENISMPHAVPTATNRDVGPEKSAELSMMVAGSPAVEDRESKQGIPTGTVTRRQGKYYPIFKTSHDHDDDKHGITFHHTYPEKLIKFVKSLVEDAAWEQLFMRMVRMVVDEFVDKILHHLFTKDKDDHKERSMSDSANVPLASRILPHTVRPITQVVRMRRSVETDADDTIKHSFFSIARKFIEMMSKESSNSSFPREIHEQNNPSIGKTSQDSSGGVVNEQELTTNDLTVNDFKAQTPNTEAEFDSINGHQNFYDEFNTLKSKFLKQFIKYLREKRNEIRQNKRTRLPIREENLRMSRRSKVDGSYENVKQRAIQFHDRNRHISKGSDTLEKFMDHRNRLKDNGLYGEPEVEPNPWEDNNSADIREVDLGGRDSAIDIQLNGNITKMLDDLIKSLMQKHTSMYDSLRTIIFDGLKSFQTSLMGKIQDINDYPGADSNRSKRFKRSFDLFYDFMDDSDGAKSQPIGTKRLFQDTHDDADRVGSRPRRPTKTGGDDGSRLWYSNKPPNQWRVQECSLRSACDAGRLLSRLPSVHDITKQLRSPGHEPHWEALLWGMQRKKCSRILCKRFRVRKGSKYSRRFHPATHAFLAHQVNEEVS